MSCSWPNNCFWEWQNHENKRKHATLQCIYYPFHFLLLLQVVVSVKRYLIYFVSYGKTTVLVNVFPDFLEKYQFSLSSIKSSHAMESR